jgi:DNA-3-methyladenine glycosylase
MTQSIFGNAIDFFAPSHQVAHQLIGATFTINGVGGIIVETEAYDQLDPASHTFVGKTKRNAAMFGAPGCAYVYRSYGIHWCLNFVCGAEGHGAGVLIRAIEPIVGLKAMIERRGVSKVNLLCSGPGKLGQALAVEHDFNGMPLNKFPFELIPAQKPADVICGPRIGISKAVDVPWRFGLSGSPFLSRPFR